MYGLGDEGQDGGKDAAAVIRAEHLVHEVTSLEPNEEMELWLICPREWPRAWKFLAAHAFLELKRALAPICGPEWRTEVARILPPGAHDFDPSPLIDAIERRGGDFALGDDASDLGPRPATPENEYERERSRVTGRR